MGCREQSHLLPSQWGNSEVRLHTWWDFHAQVLCLGGGATDAMTTHHSPFHYMLCCWTKHLLAKSCQVYTLCRLLCENKSFSLAQMLVKNIPPQSKVSWNILYLAFFRISYKRAQQILQCNKLQFTFLWYINYQQSNNCLN